MRRHASVPILLAAAIVLMGYMPLGAAEQKGSPYLRFVQEGKDSGRLETSVVTFTNEKGAKVHLVSAVHIADAAYYQGLNKLFEKYDVLLYEMVKPRDMGNPGKAEQARGVGLVHIIQKGLKMFLDLDFQLDGIDYTKKNFVHADLDAETFNRLQEERGESIWGMMLQQMIKEFFKGNQKRDLAEEEMDPMELLTAFATNDGARRMKLILAKQFNNMDDMVAGLDGPDGSVLVTERNKACLKVLGDQLAAGKKNIGIFYGAAHMKDMSKRLEEMGFKPTATEWRLAWDMSPRGGRAEADNRDDQIKKLMERIEQLEKKLADKEKEKEKK